MQLLPQLLSPNVIDKGLVLKVLDISPNILIVVVIMMSTMTIVIIIMRYDEYLARVTTTLIVKVLEVASVLSVTPKGLIEALSSLNSGNDNDNDKRGDS